MSNWVTNRNHMDIEGAPNLGDQSPTNPLLIARAMKVVDLGDHRNSVLQVQFTSLNHSGTGTLYNIPIVDGSLFTYGVSFENVAVVVPATYKTKLAIQKDLGDEIIEYWAVDAENEKAETRTVIAVQWKLPVTISLNVIQLFSAQNNKIHTINGKKWVFKVGNMNAQDNSFYEVSGTWTLDEGTKAVQSRSPAKYLLPGNSDGSNSFGYEAGSIPQSGFIRDPYHRLWVIPQGDPINDAKPPTLVQIPEYDEEPNGHFTLPGIPTF